MKKIYILFAMAWKNGLGGQIHDTMELYFVGRVYSLAYIPAPVHQYGKYFETPKERQQ